MGVKFNKTLLYLLFCSITIQAQVRKNPIDSIKNKTSAYLYAHVFEKAYLQFDKPYYATGDTIYFKAYVKASNNYNTPCLSGVLYVDLINTNNKIISAELLITWRYTVPWRA